ncbi:OLC1v1036718C1 [Oldenlandia corymbosa var. corymbosa]|uniref:Glycosyltransferase n=1 Tax=Oldenlandia corymbosa var. corymbosa TaxID=529605 RepID=A0AAV1CVY3_OLDCO|nr:OLC1v1036718C1 [Oldenlandia corymbosa var. corymbosa]
MAPTNYNIQSRSQTGLLRRNHLDPVAVVMVPFPAQGHLNQLLQLSRLISAYNIPVHYVGTAAHNLQAKLRAHSRDPLSASNIHFHELPTPTFQNPPPDPNSNIKFPCHLQPLFDAASEELRGPVAALVRSLSAINRRVVIINDSLMGSVVQDFTRLTNAEAYTFHSISAFTSFFFRWESAGKPFPVDEEILKIIPALNGCFTPQFTEFIINQSDYAKNSSGRIYNSCKEMEGPFIDLLSKQEISGNTKQWALGPFNPVRVEKGKPNQSHKCLEWLEKQGMNEVIFVSFGTTTSFSDEQICEIAIGLEKSEQKFIWVLRDADKGDVFVKDSGRRSIQLPDGFEERMERKGLGLVVRNWAPQLAILEHAATGGFMSHCGWNSCMESLTMGVPIAAWPMHSDQPRNAVLVTKVLKVGVAVKDWACGDGDYNKLVTSSMVDRAVRMLMAEERGHLMRKRAAKLGAAVRSSVADGGATKKEFDAFIAHITR